MGVQPRVHALARATWTSSLTPDGGRICVVRTCGKRPTATEEYLDGCEFVDVVIMNTNALKSDIDMVELGIRIMNEPVSTSVRRSSYRGARARCVGV